MRSERTALWDVLADLYVVRTDLQTEKFGWIVLDLRDGLCEALVLRHLDCHWYWQLVWLMLLRKMEGPVRRSPESFEWWLLSSYFVILREWYSYFGLNCISVPTSLVEAFHIEVNLIRYSKSDLVMIMSRVV